MRNGALAEQTKDSARLFTLIVSKVRLAKEKLQKSCFFEEAMKQLEDPEMIVRIKRVAGPDTQGAQLQIVLYGLEIQILGRVSILNILSTN